MNQLNKLEKVLKQNSDKEKAQLLQRFFKTGVGQYGEGDVFLGIVVPKSRQIAKQFSSISFEEIQYLLNSEIHEKRLIALLILIEQYNNKPFKQKVSKPNQKIIFDFYLKNTKNINNWDLVDLSAPNIVGDFLLNKNRKVLYKLAKSKNLWEKRIAVISTFKFIRQDDFKDSLKISEILLKDKHDLIHKAVGWMLREIGKRNQKVEEKFLKKYYKKIPRTTLRYAIERFEEVKRKKYLAGEI